MAMPSDGLLLATVCALMVVTQFAPGQEPGNCPEQGGLFAAYDVVSVKPAHLDKTIPMAVYHRPDGIDGESVTVALLLRSSYLKQILPNDDVITGLPDWAKNDTFAFQAKMSAEQSAVFSQLDKGQQRACQDKMEQAMLADRFKLRMHWQARQVPVYELLVAKNGPKLKKSVGPDPNFPKGSDGKPRTGSLAWLLPLNNGIELIAQEYSTEDLARFITNQNLGLDRSVVDRTGLKEEYNFTLTFTRPQGTRRPEAGPANGLASDPGVSIFTALQEQLGLRLAPTTINLDTIVVDHVERPSEN